MASHGVERPHLVLYIRPSCPYCVKVTNYLKKEHKKIPTKDTRDKNIEKELVRKGGKRQVPCLMVNGKPLYESADILTWLKDHKDQY
ncbi:MAG: glutathione S-transferase N-terminal domain-containing protein [Simkaniaceae bacterium]|nr:MAG: glutathione S-transferase N-terminal domain-containing protein [Simkaniaceae bacterium]